MVPGFSYIRKGVIMKIAILGYSGSGKSTMARTLGAYYGCDVLHFDAVQFLPGWEVRPAEEKRRLTEDFLNTHTDWVIDGNYSKLCFDRRMREADRILILPMNRFRCLFRVVKRFLHYRNTTRPDMGEGCNEKLDAEFVKWVLWKGRTKETKARFRSVVVHYPGKTVILKTQKDIDAYLERNLTDDDGN